MGKEVEKILWMGQNIHDLPREELIKAIETAAEIIKNQHEQAESARKMNKLLYSTKYT